MKILVIVFANLLRQVPVFKRYSDEIIRKLSLVFVEKHFQKGEVVAERGKPVLELCVVSHGEFVVEVPVPDAVDEEVPPRAARVFAH